MKIVQWLEQSPWGDVTPETLKTTGMGGRESALVQLHERWNKMTGVECISFVPVEKSRDGYVDNNAARAYLENFDADVLVSWEDKYPLSSEIIRERVKFGVIEMQVAHIEMFDESTGNDLDSCWDAYCCLSEWAGNFLQLQNPQIYDRKIKVLPNGVDISRFPARNELKMASGPFKFIYSSSPDRGLVNLLDAWGDIRNIFPDSELYVCYGVENWINSSIYSHSMQGELSLKVRTNLNQPGINYMGKIGQKELAELQMQCDALLYPCDPLSPTETGCITAVEAGASYTPMILGAVDCLPSEYGECAEFVEMPFDKDAFVAKVEKLMTDEKLYIDLMKRGRAMAETRDWDVIAQNWINWFKGALNERRSYAQAA